MAMENILYIKIHHSREQLTATTRCHASTTRTTTTRNVPTAASPRHTHQNQDDDTVFEGRKQCPVPLLATCWELLFATFCSVICSAYAVNHEQFNSSPSQFSIPQFLLASQTQYSPYTYWLLDPPPTLMLFSCLILGSAVSSFAYRRQETDRFQTPIFGLGIVGAVVGGWFVGAGANLVLLGCVPWGVVGAMCLSVLVHWALGRFGKERRNCKTKVYCCESGVGEVGDKKEATPKC